MSSAPLVEGRPARQLPLLESANLAYWTSGASGQLVVSRCGDCGFYVHPPQPRCRECHSADLRATSVSGRGRVATFTVNHQVWNASAQGRFVFAAVELEEQPGLFVFTNIVGIEIDHVTIGMPVVVVFHRQEDVYLPMFKPRGAAR